MYSFARGEVPNDPNSNGEYWLLKQMLTGAKSPQVLLDVGANKGDWTARALEIGQTPGSLSIHTFEPSTATRNLLSARFREKSGVRVHSQAMSDRPGERMFYGDKEGAGTNSLDPLSGPGKESVPVTTLDLFFESEGLAAAAMVKIDTEGFDLLVLKGAANLLRDGRVDVFQFEYNWRWHLNHACLRDVFDLIEGKPYSLGKLVGQQIEFYDNWHFELDRFFENNYVLVREGHPLRGLGLNMKFATSNVAVAT
ncbi:MAG: FkbM family methyltransferase [Planctomycetota bacterium]